jgi:hypothetical protein
VIVVGIIVVNVVTTVSAVNAAKIFAIVSVTVAKPVVIK